MNPPLVFEGSPAGLAPPLTISSFLAKIKDPLCDFEVRAKYDSYYFHQPLYNNFMV
jgi:hypothetical protein